MSAFKFGSIAALAFPLSVLGCNAILGNNGNRHLAGGSGGLSDEAGGDGDSEAKSGTSGLGAGGKAPTAGSKGHAGASGEAGADNCGDGAAQCVGGTDAGGASSGSGGAPAAGAAGGGGVVPAPSVLVTSTVGAYWKTGTWTETTSGSPDVTVNDSAVAQKWDGFGGTFNELGWSYLTTSALKGQAVQLLFGSDGAHFAWGRIPIGASDYAVSRYDETSSADAVPNTGEANRPALDPTLANFSLTRDNQYLIPYIKAAQTVNPSLRFWASPWTPPLWMKTGYKQNSSADGGGAKRPSYYDGGSAKADAASLNAYAQYFTKFVQGYQAAGIDIELVSPQNEPTFDMNYPSCLWDKASYVVWIKNYLGPAMSTLGVKLMLGTLSNSAAGTDPDLAAAVLADSTAKGFLTVIGAQWAMLDAAKLEPLGSTLSIWATEHKCGNYPWNPAGSPAYNSAQAPNDVPYALESWGNIRDAITQIKVTAYIVPNLVLDTSGLGVDTSRDWKQNALLVASGTTLTPTPAYYVFRHLSQYVAADAQVVGTSGGDGVAFKNPDGSIVLVLYNSGAAKSDFTVALHGKTVQFAMPAAGWATIRL